MHYSIGTKMFTGHLHDSYILGETTEDLVASRVALLVDSDANRGACTTVGMGEPNHASFFVSCIVICSCRHEAFSRSRTRTWRLIVGNQTCRHYMCLAANDRSSCCHGITTAATDWRYRLESPAAIRCQPKE